MKEHGRGMSFALGLLAGYLLTALCLLLLSVLQFKLGLKEGAVSVGISVIYVISTLAAGFLCGKRMQKQRYLWGCLEGCAYFFLLAILSILLGKEAGTAGHNAFSALFLCAAGGMLGGMIS